MSAPLLNMEHACKILVASGINKSDTHQIIRTLRREQNGSGPVFLFERLKTLRKFCEDRITGEPCDLPWFKKTKSGLPKDHGWRLLVSDQEKGLQHVSVLLMEMVNIPDQKTKDVIYDNIHRHDTISKDVLDRFVRPNDEFISAFRKAYYNPHVRYSPETLHGVSFPLYEGKTYRVKTDKRGNKDKDSVLTLYYEGLCSAPYILADHFHRKADLFTLGEAERFLPKSSVKEHKDSEEYFRCLADIVSVEAFDNNSDLEETYGGDLSMVEIPHIVGAISVIPSPGMKDRVIANPNPSIQFALYELGEYLGKVTKRLQCCYVFNQNAGIRKVQEYLKQGITLASIDMTAATDRLSSEAGVALIRQCIQPLNFPKWFKDMYPDRKDISNQDHIECDLDFFEEVSRSAFYIGNIGEDDIEYVSYTQGQPMGLKPSFPLLTLMNIKAGMDAQQSVPGSVSPIVVGDDIVIDARCLSHYTETITGLGGVINLDKTCISSTYAKFCSRIITPHSVVRIKPRFVKGDRMKNALQLGNIHFLKPWEKKVAYDAAVNSIDDIDNINVNVDKSPLITRITDRAIQRLLDNGLDSELYTIQPEIAKLNLDLRMDQTTDFHNEITKEREQRFQYETGESLSDVYSSLDFIDHLSEVTIPTSITTYDHHNDRRQVKSRDINRIRRIGKSSKSNEVSQASIDHHEGELLYDERDAIFAPKGSKVTINLRDIVSKEKKKVIEEIDNSPISNKRKRIASEKILEQISSNGESFDDEFSL